MGGDQRPDRIDINCGDGWLNGKRRASSTAGPVPNQLVIGVTWPIAAGKSTVAALLREHGASVIDADRVYESLLEPGSALWRQLRDRFGSTIVTSEGVDRTALGN